MTHSECVIAALRIQSAMCMRHIVVCDLPGSTILPTLSHKRQNFREKIMNMKRVFWFPLHLFSETFLILRTERDVIKNLYWSSVLMKLPFSRYILKKYLNTKFHEKPSFSMRTDERTGVTKLIAAFRNVAEPPTNYTCVFLVSNV